MSSYQYRKSHCGDKTILRPSYLHNGISYTGKMTSLYWIRALDLYVTRSSATMILTMHNKPVPGFQEERFQPPVPSQLWEMIYTHVLMNKNKFSTTQVNTWRPRQNGRHFADAIFRCIFLNENVWTPVKISLKFVARGPINNIPAMVEIMAWRRPGDKPLSEPMMVSLLTHICVAQPQWVNVSTN